MEKDWHHEEYWHRPYFMYREEASVVQETDEAALVEQSNLEQQGAVVYEAGKKQQMHE